METMLALFQCILVPIDGSNTSLNAARVAIRMARTLNSKLRFLYVVDTKALAQMAHFTGRAEQDMKVDLEREGLHYLGYASELAAAAHQKATTILRVGVPQREITTEAREQGADLIVIGRVGQRGPRRILIGSVAERVIEYAPCPVLVVQR